MRSRPSATMLLLASVLTTALCGGRAYAQQHRHAPADIRGCETVVYGRGDFETKGHLSVPRGNGPFPAVVYNHGGLGNLIGGAPEETAHALAEAGFVGFSPIRRPTVSMRGHLGDVMAAIDYVKQLDYVDENRIALIGFSRGGLLAFMAGARRTDLEAVVVMAAAPGGRDPNLLPSQAQYVSAPVLLLVAENDTTQANHVELMRRTERALQEAGKSARMIVYPPYGTDGHRMFFEVGAYWSDVVTFLRERL